MDGFAGLRPFVFAIAIVATTLSNAAFAAKALTNPNAVWVTENAGILRIDTVSRDILLNIPVKEAVHALAVDRQTGNVWAVVGNTLNAFDPHGTPLLDQPISGIPARSSLHLGVDGNAGVVWIAAGARLQRFSLAGQSLGVTHLDGDIVDIDAAREVGERPAVLWAITRKHAYAVDTNGNARVVANAHSRRYVALSYDEKSGQLWLANQAGAIQVLTEHGQVFTQILSPLPTPLKFLSADEHGGAWLGGVQSLAYVHTAGGNYPVVRPFIDKQIIGKPKHSASSGGGNINALHADPADRSVWVINNKNLVHLSFRGEYPFTVALSHAVTMDLHIDTDPPEIHITAPEEGTFTNNNREPTALSYIDVGSRIDPETIEIQSNDQLLAVTCDADEFQGKCVPDTALDDGGLTLIATVADLAGNRSEPDKLRFTVDTVPPEITVTRPEQNSVTNQADNNLTGGLNEPGKLTINNRTIELDDDNAFNFSLSLTEGENRIELRAEDRASNAAEFTLIVTLDTVPPAAPNLGLIAIEDVGDGRVKIIGAPGALQPGTRVSITNPRTGEHVLVAVNSDGSFSAILNANPGDALEITAVDPASNHSEPGEVKVPSPAEQLPPDPTDIAPPLPDNTYVSFHESIRFLYDSLTPVQTGVVVGAIDTDRAAVLRGRIIDHKGHAVSGVEVTVHQGREYGKTLSREDGKYDLVVNGGEAVTLEFSKKGYLPVQRSFHAPRANYHGLDDIALTSMDSAATPIKTFSREYQDAVASAVSDADGTRQARMLFRPFTRAYLRMPDGTRETLDAFTFRATEYTVGETGPNAMPASLPPESAYTYAVELSADEAITAGASSVEFSRPVSFYLDNFLDFPTGTVIPVGWYDREKATWLPSENGRVIEILGYDAGRDTYGIDLNGDGFAADESELDEFGIYYSEARYMHQTWPVGTRIWRAEIRHFTPYDLNFLRHMLRNEDIGAPQLNLPPQNNQDSNDSDICKGCIIEAQAGVVREEIPVAGTSAKLTYSTRNNNPPPGSFSLRLQKPISTGFNPKFSVKVFGETVFSQTLSGEAGEVTNFEWDGTDPYGRKVYTPTTAEATYSYSVKSCYLPPTESEFYSFATQELVSTDFDPGDCVEPRLDWPRTRTWEVKIQAREPKLNMIGNWQISPVHFFKADTGEIRRGDGTSAKALPVAEIRPYQMLESTNSDAAGIGLPEAIGRNINDVSMNSVQAMVFSPDGNRYLISDVEEDMRVYRVDSDGFISVFANLPQGSYMENLFLGADGRLYVVWSNGDQSAPARIGKDGSVKIWGRNFIFFHNSGLQEGNYANDVFPLDSAAAYAAGPDGRIYFYENNTSAIWVIAADERVYRWAEDVGSVWDMHFSEDGMLYVTTFREILRFDGGGRETWLGSAAVQPRVEGDLSGLRKIVYAGSGKFIAHRKQYNNGQWVDIFEAYSEQYGLESLTDQESQLDCKADTIDLVGFIETLCLPDRIRLIGASPEGDIVLASRFLATLKKSVAPKTEDLVAMKDPDYERVYQFDSAGRHHATFDLITGQQLWSFDYDDNGHLTRLTDNFGNTTRVEKNGGEWILTSPDNHQTLLQENADGYITRVLVPGDRQWQFDYYSGGRVKTATDPNGNRNEFTYSDGRLATDTWPNGGGWNFQDDGSPSGYANKTIRQISGEGRETTYHIEDFGKFTRTTTPAGLTATRQIGSGIEYQVNPDGSQTKTKQKNYQLAEQNYFFPGHTQLNVGEQKLHFETDREIAEGGNTHPFDIATWRDLNKRYYLDQFGHQFSTHSAKQYTSQDRAFRFTSAEGRQVQTYLDFRFLPALSRIPGFAETRFNYDTRGRLIETTVGEGEAQRKTRLAYHASGHQAGYLASVTDALGRSVSFEYDAAGRVNRQVLPGGREIAYEYDNNGNLTAITPPGKPAHRFSYTVMDQAGSYTPPELGTGETLTQFTYNLDKQLERITRPDGKAIDYVYGQTTGRLNQIITPSGQYDYGYDPVTGHIATLTAPGNQTTTYTREGFLLTGVEQQGTVSGRLTMDYDPFLRMNRLSVNDQIIGMQYDNDDLLVQAGGLKLLREPKAGLVVGSIQNAVRTQRFYSDFMEAESEAVRVNDEDIHTTSYIRDKLGRITQKTETLNGTTSVTGFTYDQAGQLKTVTTNGQTTTYAYDHNGNRTHVNGVEVAAYDAQDRLLNYGNKTFTYSNNGDLESKIEAGTTTTYNYDVFGNLRAVTLPGDITIEYVIDGQNRRIGKKVNGQLVQGFLYQDQLNPVAELDGNNNVVARFVYGEKPNVPDYMIKDGVEYRIISDHLGSPRLIINAETGEIAQEITYDVWGNITKDTNPGFQPFGFAGGIYDHHTNLIRFGARDYDPITGRWTAKDPIGFDGGFNHYAYVSNDPVNLVDSTGLVAPIVGVGIGALVGGIAQSVATALNGGTASEVGVAFLGGALAGAAITAGALMGGVPGLIFGVGIGMGLDAITAGQALADELNTGMICTSHIPAFGGVR